MSSYNVSEPTNNNVAARGLGSSITIFLAILIPTLYAVYKLMIPKPIPGIPYNAEGAKSVFGDIPDLIPAVAKDGEPITWLQDQPQRLNSPVVQVFIRPFAKPMVILADFREAKDLLMRRKEFDRSAIMGDLFAGLVPNHHIHQPTNALWKGHRKLLQDLMLPQFLQQIAAPSIYRNTSNLVRLWREKCRLANGRPFSAAEDIFHAALDAVLAFSFGDNFPHRAISTDTEFLSQPNDGDVTEGVDEPVQFPPGSVDVAIKATLDLTGALEDLQASFFPRWRWSYLANATSLRHAIQIKDKYIHQELKKAVERLSNAADDDSNVRSAMELMVRRERKLAEEDGRKPEFNSTTIRDETFGFIVAGHDTTSTTVLWGLKLLADHPHVQVRLRSSMQSSMPEAWGEKRDPSIDEITRASNPYLDATVEEMLRCAGTVPAVDRQALSDTTLLGYPIPKGTVVMCMGQGPSMRSPAFDIEESRRNGTSRQSTGEGHFDLALFEPSRWLSTATAGDEKKVEGSSVDEESFDGTAAPQLSFGLGKRGCYGKRLAYLELRILMALIVWNFELLPCPEQLSSYKGLLGITKKPRDSYVRLRRVS